ncbi:Methyl-accepting chemotaxis protein PctB [Vibrio palustris]|uniref:Methyl-accepting chemotaxis protein PctB n=2 Tax=Vibrio palustris TaxID=1918946 RepID=A0A1R4B609_9VIBR|nr:methyl-accepting chemotaxis protein [Vibrio palustris]SJL84348.1 Methyl-accepting chemotaxis protein PctB [Vibrio palustris]
MQLTLKRKMVFSVVLAITLTAGALLIAGYQAFKAETWRYIESESINTLNAHAKGISDWIETKQATIHGLAQEVASNPEADVVPFLRQAYTSGAFGLTYYGEENGDMHRQDPSLNKAGYDPRARGWYKLAKAQGKAVTTEPYVSVTMQALVVTLAEPIMENGQLIGVAASNLSLDKIIRDVLAIKVPGNGYAILVSDNGTIIAHPNKDMILKNINDIAPQLTMQKLAMAIQDHDQLEENIGGKSSIMMASDISNTDWNLVMVMNKSVLEQPLNQMLITQLLIGFAILVIMGVVTSWFVALQLRGLTNITNALTDIAEGDGDLTRRLEVNSSDEVGILADKFNKFVSRLHNMVVNVKAVSTHLNEGANSSATAANQRRERIQQQQNEITMVATAVTEMASATAEIAGNADNTASNANQSVELGDQSYQQMQQSKQSIDQLAAELTSAVAIIGELEVNANEISTILSTIRGIAEQTNLLALNAAIEAARAGEQGRGFAVVADEVRVLSQRTHASTEEIQTKISSLQSVTKNAVTAMTDSHNLVETSVGDVNQTAESLQAISNAIRSISDMATQIAAAAEEQSLVTSDINTNTESVREVSEQLASDAVAAVDKAKELHELANQLEQEISRFKL